MSNDFTPRARYLKSHGDEAEQWGKIVKTPMCENAMFATLAELAFKGISAEQLKGASDYMEALRHIGDAQKPPAKYPIKRLASMAAPTIENQDEQTENKK